MRRAVSDERLFCYLEREVTASEAAAIDTALEDPACRRRLQALGRLLEDLAAPVPPAMEVDVAAAVRARIEAGDVGGGGRGRRGRGMAAAIAVVAVAGGIGLAIGLHGRAHVAARGAGPGTTSRGAAAAARPPSRAGAAAGARGREIALVGTGRAPRGEFLAKSSGAVPAADRWVAIDAYRVPPGAGADPERLGRRIGARDGLLFAYSNAASPPFRYLMIFAVDARGRVYWYYPAYEHAGENPASVAVDATEVHRRELPDLIHQHYAPGRLVIYGLFTRKRLHVHAVERTIANMVRGGRWDAARPPRLPIPGAGQQRIAVEVTR